MAVQTAAVVVVVAVEVEDVAVIVVVETVVGVAETVNIDSKR